MSIETVKAWFRELGMEDRVMEFPVSSATVELAAEAVSVIPARICKTLAFRTPAGCVLIQTAGDVRIDNAKFKETFGLKAKMLTPEEVLIYTGHPVGGVCAFAVTHPDARIYADVSLQRFETVFPACGSENSAIELTTDDLFRFSGALEWVDVCKKQR